jgi:hypothetical protein
MNFKGLMVLLVALDLNFVYLAYTHTMTKGASVQLVFGFEVINEFESDLIFLFSE